MALKDCVAIANWLIFLNFIFYCFQLVNLYEIQSLGGLWNVENIKRGYNFPGIVPGGIYSDLMRNNLIEDVFYRFNDIETRWVSKLNWNYSKWFTVEDELLSHNNINLIFDGIDTFANITINGRFVDATDNMFVRYVFDIKPHLQPGENSITVQFKSPVNVASSLFEKQTENYLVPPKCVPDSYHGECHVNHIRKMQASFAWDWGPAFPSMGIWKSVYIEAFNASVIRDVTVDVHVNTTTDDWDVRISTYLADSRGKNIIEGTIIFKLQTDIERVIKIYKIEVFKDKQGEFVFTQTISIPKSYVRLWWPNGYGDANLYVLKVYYKSPNDNEKTIKRLKIGFRTVELVQNEVGENGRTFYFKINGLPIFAKGSNVIPISILPELGQNETTIRFLLESAKVAHMNMLRVWGGGVYESDTFYKVADEMGLMIWQDFMFACSMYPTTKEFLSSVREEVKHQVKRLQYHPSIIVWAGNNENEGALRGNWYGTSNNFTLYYNDYVTLYVDTVKNELLFYDKTRPFLTSSPTNGKKSDEEGYVAKNPASVYYGDVHFYNYYFDSLNTADYPINRFSSEYGYQSLPSVTTILTATDILSDLAINSTFLSSRQHQLFGYANIERIIQFHLDLPSEDNENYTKIFMFYSQIMQAMSIKIETEYYRQWRSTINDAGQGLTMGALYWQLNDVWVAPSWSSIDFKNNWKMLHYFAKKFFAPVIITGNKLIDNSIDVYVVSDLLKPIYNSSLNILTYTWDSFDPVFQQSLQVDVLPGFSQKITRISWYEPNTDVDKKCGQFLENCLLYFTLHDNKNETIAPDNFIFPIPLKSAKVQTPTVKITSVKQLNQTLDVFEITVETNAIALFVWLSVDNIPGLLSDNGFVQVTLAKTVHFYAKRTTTTSELQRSITVACFLNYDYL